jgi:predicted enzyme related to lactoylglutathione lyase
MNMKRTRAFYQDLFGFKRGCEWNNAWSEFKTEPVTFCLNGPSPKMGTKLQGPGAIAFSVADIHQAISECRRRRVKVLLDPIETTVCWMAIIQDPAGNRLCLHQRKDGTAG